MGQLWRGFHALRIAGAPDSLNLAARRPGRRLHGDLFPQRLAAFSEGELAFTLAVEARLISIES